MNLTQTLLRLQTIDQEWGEKAHQYQAAKQQLSDQSELLDKRQEQADRDEALSALKAKLRDAELELATLCDKAKTVEDALYGGGGMSPRELENLRRDSEQLKQRISQLEDQILSDMTDADDLATQVAQGKTDIDAFEVAWRQKRQALSTQYKTTRARLQELKALREQIKSSLPRAELALYDELRAKKAGLALAPIRDGVCQVCRVTVPTSKIQRVASGLEAVTCEGCGRILYPA